MATNVKSWEYNYATTLGTHFHFAVIEELVWMVLVFMVVAMVIEVYIARKQQ